jgi:DNA-binding GntR family transcriptional regulator
MQAQRSITPLTPIDRQGSLGELAYNALKDQIIRGGFKPGEKLTVRSVAQALGVSTTPARDALNRLIGEGALENIGPKTVVVPVLTKMALDEVTTIRLALEGLAAEHGTPNVPERDIAGLEQLQDKLIKAMDSAQYQKVLHFNKDFHFTIYKAAQMPRLVLMIETLWLRIGPSLNDLYPEFAQSRRGISNHLTAIKALRKRDAAAVRNAMETDIHDGYRRLVNCLRVPAETA